MIKIAIVEDNELDAQKVKDFILKCAQNSRGDTLDFNISIFDKGVDFINNFYPDFDIVFMDIEMPYLNGYETAKYLRSLDSDVALVFITALAKYAIKGYDVDALDFMVKPIEFDSFSNKFKKILAYVEKRKRDSNKQIILKQENGFERVSLNDIFYVEVFGHNLIYYLKDRKISVRGQMNQIEKLFIKNNFFRCYDSYLVNLSKIVEIKTNTVVVASGNELPVSRRKKKEFVEAFAKSI